jgi:hypothetical protein
MRRSCADHSREVVEAWRPRRTSCVGEEADWTKRAKEVEVQRIRFHTFQLERARRRRQEERRGGVRFQEVSTSIRGGRAALSETRFGSESSSEELEMD